MPELRFLIQSFVSVLFDYISVGFEIKTLCYRSFVFSSCRSAGSQIRNFNADDASSMAASTANKTPEDKDVLCSALCCSR
jgi:hypothetical protein